MTDNRDSRKSRAGTRKAGNGEGTWFFLPNGSIRCEITVRDATGKVFRKTKTVKGGSGEMGRKNQALRELREEYPGGKVPEPGQTVGECLDEWSSHYLSNVAGSTADNYRTMVNQHLRPGLGTKLLSDLTTADVNRFLIRMASAVRGGDGGREQRIGYSKSTIRLAKKVLGMALQHAKSEGRVNENVARHAKVPNAPERSTRSFSRDEVNAFVAAAAGDRLEAAWLIGLGLGLRPGELLALSWDDVRGTDLHIRHSQRREGGELLPRDRLKTEASLRVLAMPDAISGALEARKRMQIQEQVEAGTLWQNPLRLIFTTLRGEPLREEALRRQFLKLLNRAGVDSAGVTPHTLRHTATTFLVEAGIPLGTVSDMLGHSDLTMLVRTYRHRTSAKVTGHVSAAADVLSGVSWIDDQVATGVATHR